MGRRVIRDGNLNNRINIGNVRVGSVNVNVTDSSLNFTKSKARTLIDEWASKNTPEYFVENPGFFHVRLKNDRALVHEGIANLRNRGFESPEKDNYEKWKSDYETLVQSVRYHMDRLTARGKWEAESFSMKTKTDVKKIQNLYMKSKEFGETPVIGQQSLSKAERILKKNENFIVPSTPFFNIKSVERKGDFGLRGFALIAATTLGITWLGIVFFQPNMEPRQAPDPVPSVPVSPIDITQESIIPILTVVGAVAALIMLCFLLYFALSWWKGTENVRNQRALDTEQKRKESAELEASQEQVWNKILAKGDACVEAWVNKSTNLEFVLNNPLIGDVNEPLVGNVISLVQDFRRFRSDVRPQGSDDLWDTRLGKVVHELDNAIALLLRKAAAVRDKNYTPAERNELRKAQRFFALAMDQGASPNERSIAYARLRDIMENLHIMVSHELEEKLAIGMREIFALESAANPYLKVTGLENDPIIIRR